MEEHPVIALVRSKVADAGDPRRRIKRCGSLAIKSVDVNNPPVRAAECPERGAS